MGGGEMQRLLEGTKTSNRSRLANVFCGEASSRLARVSSCKPFGHNLVNILKASLAPEVHGDIVDDIQSIGNTFKLWRRTIPKDRSTYRRSERLKSTSAMLRVPVATEIWPSEPKKIHGNDWLPEYIAQLGQGSLRPFTVAEQLLIGLNYKQGRLQRFANIFQYIPTMASYSLLYIGACFPLLLTSVYGKEMKPSEYGSRTYPWLVVLTMESREEHFSLGSALALLCLQSVWLFTFLSAGRGVLIRSPDHLARRFQRLTDAHNNLNAMLSPSAAGELLLPHVDIFSLKDILAWLEIREFVHFCNRGEQVVDECNLGVIFLGFFGLCGVLVAYLLDKDWEPGLFSAMVLLLFLMVCICSAPVLLNGLRLNRSVQKQIEVMTAIRNKISRLTCHRLQAESSPSQVPIGLGNESRVPELTAISSSLETFIKDLRFNTDNVVRVLGVELTPVRLASLASMASTIGVLAQQSFYPHIEDQLRHALE